MTEAIKEAIMLEIQKRRTNIDILEAEIAALHRALDIVEAQETSRPYQ